ncbi:MAG: MopE-related protein [Myxococcota bacterium]
MASVGDVDSDGFADLLVGSTSGCEDGCEAFLLYGAASGFRPEQDRWRASDAVPQDRFARSMGGAGDVNGDGAPDAIIGAEDRSDTVLVGGAAYVYYGSVSGLVDEQKVVPSVRTTYLNFGSDVDGAGDVDNDGYDDVVVGAHGERSVTSYNGAVYVFYGSMSGISDREDKRLSTEPTSQALYGRTLAGGEDVDGDGFDDVIVGDWSRDLGFFAGSAWLHYGSATGLSTHQVRIVPPDIGTNYGFGTTILSPGDLTDDGYGDLLITSSLDGEWRVHFYEGHPEDYDSDGVGIDRDCDDEDARVGAPVTWWADADGDGYGDPGTSSGPLCTEPPSGYVDNLLDCDDTQEAVQPDAAEVCGDGIDNDCDGFGGLEDDEDSDGLSGAEEAAAGTDPCDEDTDGDGLTDGAEVEDHRTDPLDADTDEDGLTDGAEVQTHRTDPLDADTDGDGMSDGDEVAAGRDPLTADIVEDDTGTPSSPPPAPDGCGRGCASSRHNAPVGVVWWVVVGAAAFLRRRTAAARRAE